MQQTLARPRFERYQVFVDESSQNGHRYLVIGALVVHAAEVESVRRALHECRLRHGLAQEMKWAKVSRSYCDGYEDVVLCGLKALRTSTPAYYCFVADTQELDHRRYNGGSSETGFSKFVYQLLMKCARLYCRGGAPIDCFLDDRTTKQTLEELRQILNSGSHKHFQQRPFRRVEFRDSKTCELIQLVDMLTGAVAYHWNGHHRLDGASPHRVRLSATIATEVGMKSLAEATSPGRDSFSVWKFAPGPKGSPKRA